MQRELEYISKANAWVYENLCDKQLLGVCVCEALGERKLPYGVYWVPIFNILISDCVLEQLSCRGGYLVVTYKKISREMSCQSKDPV